MLPSELEEFFVHNVYDSISEHFSSTRYKPWPLVSKFLESLPAGSIGLDAGTGNGKYLNIATILPLEKDAVILNRKVLMLGMDRSRGLLDIATKRGHETLLSDCLYSCWRTGAFDFAISIATIHHLVTSERRKRAVQALLSSISKSHGRLFIQVWAQEQQNETSLNRRGDNVKPIATAAKEAIFDSDQDVLVPWHKKPAKGSEAKEDVHQRYYHLFKEGELLQLVKDAIVESGATVADPLIEVEKGSWVVQVEEVYERGNCELLVRRL